MDRLRRTSVAGTWYPAQPAVLANAVDQYAAAADVGAVRRPRALIAPHAGLMYSGPVAAFAYKAARETPFKTIVMVGPSHFVGFRGVSVWPSGEWETPFGPVAVD